MLRNHRLNGGKVQICLGHMVDVVREDVECDDGDKLRDLGVGDTGCADGR